MTKARFLSFAFLLGLVARATAYDNVTTHRFLSILAGERSVLGLPEAVHSSLGLKVNTFQNGEGQYRSITALLADGAEFEDGELRDAPDWRPLTPSTIRERLGASSMPSLRRPLGSRRSRGVLILSVLFSPSSSDVSSACAD